MKPLLAFCVMLLASLACIAPANSVSNTTVNKPSLANTSTPQLLASPAPTHHALLTVTGCWNVRAEPNLDAMIKRVQCGGTVTVSGSTRGWLHLGDGYICNRAAGTQEECQ